MIEAARADLRRADPAVREALSRLRAAHRLEQLPTFLAPVLLDGKKRAKVAHLAEVLHGALVKVQRAYFEAGRFREEMRFPAGLEALALEAPSLTTVRLDLVADADFRFVKVIEAQTGDPSGAGWTDLLWRGLAAHPALEGVAAPGLIAAQRATALALCQSEAPRVAFLCPEDALVRTDHEAMAFLWREAGCDAHVVDPRSLGEHEPFDLLMRDTHDEIVGPGFDEETKALQSILRAGTIPCVNPIRDALLDDKGCFVVLTDPDNAALFTAVEREVIQQYVPRTRFLTEAGAWRESSVLKPTDGYGGHEVIVGPFTSDAEWARALERAARTRTVVQDYVPVVRYALPDLEGDDRARCLALSLWLHGGRFSGAYARLSDEPVVNVHQGGGIVPAVFIG